MAKKDTPKTDVKSDETPVAAPVNDVKPAEPQVKPLRFGNPVLPVDIVMAKEKIETWRKTGKHSFTYEEVGTDSGVVIVGTKNEDFMVDFNKIPANSTAELGLLRLGLTTRIRNLFARPAGSPVLSDMAKTELVRDSIELLFQGLWSKPTKAGKTAEEKAADDARKERIGTLKGYADFVRGDEYNEAVETLTKKREQGKLKFADDELVVILRLAEILTN